MSIGEKLMQKGVAFWSQGKHSKRLSPDPPLGVVGVFVLRS